VELSEINVLVIDDVRVIRVHIRDVLTGVGFRSIKCVESPEEALEEMKFNRFDLILCDWHMSTTDGLSFLRMVRTHPRFAETPFVLITAESTREKVLEAIQHGVDDYIIKPLTIGQVKTKVFNALVKRKKLQ
jgi:two-component system chemotaxis response regulator CheY